MASHALISKIELFNDRTKKEMGTLNNVPQSETIAHLKTRIHHLYPRLYESRLRLKQFGSKEVLPNSTLLSNLIGSGNDHRLAISVKDLGPQISWRGVFIAEYVGPLLIYLIAYTLNNFVLANGPRNPIVHIAAICWSFHFVKRIYESCFVHRFSQETMPFVNLFKNCGYYWGFAIWIAYLINHDHYKQ
ncbi:hypothetical protein ACOME3_008670 [Neoechinorhynchus agilis]